MGEPIPQANSRPPNAARAYWRSPPRRCDPWEAAASPGRGRPPHPARRASYHARRASQRAQVGPAAPSQRRDARNRRRTHLPTAHATAVPKKHQACRTTQARTPASTMHRAGAGRPPALRAMPATPERTDCAQVAATRSASTGAANASHVPRDRSRAGPSQSVAASLRHLAPHRPFPGRGAASRPWAQPLAACGDHPPASPASGAAPDPAHRAVRCSAARPRFPATAACHARRQASPVHSPDAWRADEKTCSEPERFRNPVPKPEEPNRRCFRHSRNPQALAVPVRRTAAHAKTPAA